MSTSVDLIAHLMRRAAFGGTAEELESLAEKGYDSVVDELLHPERFERPAEDLFDRYHWDMVHFRGGEQTNARWFYRMTNSPRILEEKVALMWHGIFATGAVKVTINTWMAKQIDMFRDNGLGNFSVLLKNLASDPAMIYWLDNQTNHADAPNENWGRELLELFSMGVGNYSEDDVKQAARAFTGWTIQQMLPRYPYGFYDTEFKKDRLDHDKASKTFLGEKGNFDGDDIIDIIVRQPATANFVAHKIYNFFVSETPNEKAEAELAEAYLNGKYEIRSVLHKLFHSDWFKKARFEKVKSPAETVVNTIKLAGLFRTPREFGLINLPGRATGMGQTLLNPPTVEGWHTGKEWIDTASLVERVNFISEKLGDRNNPGVERMVERVMQGKTSITINEMLDACLYELGSVYINDTTRQTLIEHFGDEKQFEFDDDTSREEFKNTVTEALSLLGVSREFQMQ